MRPDAVVMAAGMSSVRLAWDDPPAAFASNSRGVFNLLEALGRSAPDAHLTMLSSASVYGPPESLPLTEESAAEPSSPYGASKLAAEMLCRQHARRHGTGVAVLRLFNSIGPGQGTGQAPSEFARQIAIAEKRGERGLMITVGNPDSERDFTDVRDVADGIAGAVSGRLEGTFNLCSGRAATIGSIVHGLNLATRVEVGMLVDPERAHPADVTSLYGSCQKLGTAIVFAPETVLEQSLEDLLEDWRTRA